MITMNTQHSTQHSTQRGTQHNTHSTSAREILSTTDGRVTVETSLTDSEVAAILETSSNKFGRSVCYKRQIHGSWTQNQRTWAHKIALEIQDPSRRLHTTDLGDFSRLADMFAIAGSQLKRPRIEFEFDDQRICLHVAGPKSKYNGQILITDGRRYPDNRFYGRIDTSGQFHPAHQCTQEIVEFLRLFARDPVAFVQNYGRKSGRCCFCRQRLTDDRSVTVGMGPVCAKNYGMEKAWREAAQTSRS